jgi:hypothetical protein
MLARAAGSVERKHKRDALCAGREIFELDGSSAVAHLKILER